jgi:hypothetical protein
MRSYFVTSTNLILLVSTNYFLYNFLFSFKYESNILYFLILITETIFLHYVVQNRKESRAENFLLLLVIEGSPL